MSEEKKYVDITLDACSNMLTRKVKLKMLSEKTYYEYFCVIEKLRKYLLNLKEDVVEDTFLIKVKEWDNLGKNVDTVQTIKKQVELMHYGIF